MPMKNFSQQIHLNFAMDVRVSFRAVGGASVMFLESGDP